MVQQTRVVRVRPRLVINLSWSKRQTTNVRSRPKADIQFTLISYLSLHHFFTIVYSYQGFRLKLVIG